MQESKITYKNLGIFLISLLLINIAVGFYNSFTKKKASNGLNVNYTIRNTKFFDKTSSDITVDYISESSEMMEIFNKYQFSVDNLEDFTGFVIKIVMSSTNESQPIKFKDFRAIALA